MSDENQILRTIADYCHFVDNGRFDEWADLFTEDATFGVPGNMVRGRQIIRDAMVAAYSAQELKTNHFTTNSTIDLKGDRAEVSSYWMLLFPSSEGPVVKATGYYQDVLVREVDRWRFATREAVWPSEWSGLNP